MDSIKDFFKSNKISVWVTVVSVLVLYGKHAFSTFVGVDSEQFIQELYGKDWLISGLGRFGMYYSIMGMNFGHYNPYLNGMLFLLLFIFTVLAWIYVFRIYSQKDNMPFYFFAASFCSYPLWAHQFYFSHQQAAMVLAFFLQAISFALLGWGIKKGKKDIRTALILVSSILMEVWAFGTYQSFVGFHLSSAACLILLDFDRLYEEKESPSEVNKTFWLDITKIVIHFICCFAAYELILKAFKMGQSNYLSIAWGNVPIKDILKTFLLDYFNVLFGKGEYKGIILLVGIVVVLLYGNIIKKSVMLTIDYLLAFVGSILGMSALNFAIGYLPPERARLSVSFTVAFMGMYSLDILFRRQKSNIKYVSILAVSSVFIVSILGQTGDLLRMFYSMDICDKQQFAVGTEIVSEIEKEVGSNSVPVVIYGRWDAPLNQACVKKEQIGVSSFTYDYNDGDKTSATRRSILYMNAAFGTDYFIPDESMKEEARQIAESIPKYPSDGFVMKRDGFVVVKLSD